MLCSALISTVFQCDERRPQCTGCSSSGLSCVYESVAIPEPPKIGFRAYSTLDLELLHHYCTNANKSLAPSIGIKPHDGIFTLPSIAFQFDFIIRAILALAALHLDHLQGQYQDSTVDYAAIAASHINDALPAYRLALPGISQDSCTALLIFSSLVTMYVLAMSRKGVSPFPRGHESSQHKLNIPPFDFISWLRLVTGGMIAIRPWIGYILEDVDVGPCLNFKLWTVHKTPQTEAQVQRDTILARLERIWNADADGGLIVSRTAITDLSTDARAVLTETLNSLRKTYLWVTFQADLEEAFMPDACSASDYNSPMSGTSARSLLPLFVTSSSDSATSTPGSPDTSKSQTRPIELSAILSFLFGLDSGFLLLLQRRHPLALIIMAHYAVVLQQKDVWWLRGLGEDMHAWVMEELLDQPSTVDGMNYGEIGGGWMRWVEWSKTFFKDRESIGLVHKDTGW